MKSIAKNKKNIVIASFIVLLVLVGLSAYFFIMNKSKAVTDFEKAYKDREVPSSLNDWVRVENVDLEVVKTSGDSNKVEVIGKDAIKSVSEDDQKSIRTLALNAIVDDAIPLADTTYDKRILKLQKENFFIFQEDEVKSYASIVYDPIGMGFESEEQSNLFRETFRKDVYYYSKFNGLPVTNRPYVSVLFSDDVTLDKVGYEDIRNYKFNDIGKLSNVEVNLKSEKEVKSILEKGDVKLVELSDYDSQGRVIESLADYTRPFVQIEYLYAEEAYIFVKGKSVSYLAPVLQVGGTLNSNNSNIEGFYFEGYVEILDID